MATEHICPCCDKPVNLAQGEPISRLPDAVFQVPKAERTKRVRDNPDYCRISDGDADNQGTDDRFFVRAVVPFAVEGVEKPFRWGVWVELESADDFHRILDLHDDPAQADQAPFDVKLANDLVGYDDTLELPCSLQLTGLRTRPAVVFDEDVQHPFAVEQRAGVSPHRIGEWMEPFA